MSEEARHRDDAPTHPVPTRPARAPAHRHRARPHRTCPPARHRWRLARTVRRSGPASVWPVAQADPLPGTGLLPGWLGRALITLVTTYSNPGDRVLLITPPRPPRAIPTGTAGVVLGRFGPDEFAGLAEASWALTRLGRSVQTMTAAAPPDYRPGDHACGAEPSVALTPQPSPAPCSMPTRWSGSGPGPTPADTTSGPQSNARPTATPDSSATSYRHDRSESDRGFDLVVTATHPHATEWLRECDWGPLLTPTGLLAVITYGDIAGGRLTDGASLIAATGRSRGLRVWDHIALLSTRTPGTLNPRDQSNLAAPQPVIRTASASQSGRAVPITRTHHDLVLLVSARSQTSPVEQATSTSRSTHDAVERHNVGSEGNSSDD